jgi:hypothetical protein
MWCCTHTKHQLPLTLCGGSSPSELSTTDVLVKKVLDQLSTVQTSLKAKDRYVTVTTDRHVSLRVSTYTHVCLLSTFGTCDNGLSTCAQAPEGEPDVGPVSAKKKYF